MNFRKAKKNIKARNQKQYKEQVKKYKQQKKQKRAKSKIRHPIKAVHRGNQALKDQTNGYWERGRQMAEDRLNDKPQYYYDDKTAIKGMTKNLGVGKSILIIAVIAVVLCFSVYGYIREHF